ncbi:hypothetical protein [Williamsoniiplasma lucivorax]|uniref:Uncharacterized protein n=1 Tax=Williamsoniiplasma lucivorax TaxID=209274 RepID=A0A2S5RA13_9MOLU|nr:hypothetical protein [Williamsoniiplasma lucivorax]PPE04148.1 hypothetical protein ELUCI_v1c09280 [Williamsoniiplasma lucivorax]
MKNKIPKRLNNWLKDLSQALFLLKKERKQIVATYKQTFQKQISEGQNCVQILNSLEPINLIAEKNCKEYGVVYTDTITRQAKILGWITLVFQPLIILLMTSLFIFAILWPIAVIWYSIVLYSSFDFWEASSIAFLLIGVSPLLMISFFLIVKILFNWSKQMFININWMENKAKIKAIKWKLWIGLLLIATILLGLVGGGGTIITGNNSLIHYVTNKTLKNEQIVTANIRVPAVDSLDITKVTIDGIIQRANLLKAKSLVIFQKILEEQTKQMTAAVIEEIEKLQKQLQDVRAEIQTHQNSAQVLTQNPRDSSGITDQIIRDNRTTLENSIEIEDYKVDNDLNSMFYQTHFQTMPTTDRTKVGTLIRKHNFKWDMQNKYTFLLEQKENKKYSLLIKVSPNNWTQKTVAVGGELFILYI